MQVHDTNIVINYQEGTKTTTWYFPQSFCNTTYKVVYYLFPIKRFKSKIKYIKESSLGSPGLSQQEQLFKSNFKMSVIIILR